MKLVNLCGIQSRFTILIPKNDKDLPQDFETRRNFDHHSKNRGLKLLLVPDLYLGRGVVKDAYQANRQFWNKRNPSAYFLQESPGR